MVGCMLAGVSISNTRQLYEPRLTSASTHKGVGLALMGSWLHALGSDVVYEYNNLA